ncbi:MAG: alpha/beta hydrolase [Candidatus Eisenbacteria bacterium]
MDKKRQEGKKEIPFSWILRSHIVTRETLEALFRVFGAKTVLPDLFYLRPLLMGANFLDIREAFTSIHSWEDWVGSWERIGEKRETFARLAGDEGRSVTAGENHLFAAAAFHMAQMPLFDEADRKRALYARCAECFRRAAASLSPPAAPVSIPHGSIELPGLLRLPDSKEKVPLLVLICGADSCKEEMHFFSEGLVRRGIGTLAYDGPGIGETWERCPMGIDDGGVGASLFDFLTREERIDPKRIGLFGVSLGGNLAIRIAAKEERASLVVSLSAPYDLASYAEYMLPILLEQVKYLLHTESEELVRKWAQGLSVRGLVEKMRAPLLVIGGGEDTIIPSTEAKRIFDEAKGRKKLVFYEEANHLCTEHAFDLIGKVEEWLIETGYLAAGPSL